MRGRVVVASDIDGVWRAPTEDELVEIRAALATQEPEPAYCPHCDVIAVPGTCCRASERPETEVGNG